ncbi:HAD-like domain-containing protein [Parasitella parasitica]|nr:HAD-like domain-containing protein [Parasitella parasitica]
MEKVELKRLQTEKKLVLVIDLDHTLIHATSVYDVAEWINKQKRSATHRSRVKELFTVCGNKFSFKLRPGLHRFLTQLSSMYEFHVYTMGNKAYAEAFLDRIDPHRTLFKGRVLTRDGNGCILKKKLSRLYPTNQTQVLVLDDCANVWDNSPNLIQIKPYVFFKNVKQVNPLTHAKPIKNRLFSFVNNYSTSLNIKNNYHDDHQQSDFKLDDSDFLMPPPPFDDDHNFSISSTCTNQTDTFLDESIADIIPETLENDRALENVGKLLKDIHSIYFKNLSCNIEPDVVSILQSLCTETRTPMLRRKRSSSSSEPDYVPNKKCNNICRSTSSTTLTIP